MFLHHFICSVHFPTVQKHTGFETIPHPYWNNDKGVKPANGFQPAFSGHSVSSPYSRLNLVLAYGISPAFRWGVHSLSVHTNMYYECSSTYICIHTMYDDISSTVIMLHQFDQGKTWEIQ